jgi:DNA-binding NarL/FixJ family response regulator
VTKAESTPRVVIIDDHLILTESLKLAFQLEGFDEVGVVYVPPLTDAEVVQAVAALGPEVVLLDLHLGGRRLGTPLIGPLRDLGARVLILTSSEDEILLAECLEQGADGIFSKSRPFEDLMALLRDAAMGHTLMQPAMREELLAALRHTRAAGRGLKEPFERLTPKEAAVFAAIIEGQAADEISAHQYLSEATVRTHIRAILRKLGVNSQLAAVALARRAGWPPAS